MKASQMNARWDQLQKRRTDLENIRAMNVKRLRADFQRLARREVDYTKGLIQEIIPVKVTVNEDALNRLKDFFPFQVELDFQKDNDRKTVEPSAVILEEDDKKAKKAGEDLP